MIYLSGCISQTMLANPRSDLGIMYQPGMGAVDYGRSLQFTWHALDNGCFAHGEKFDSGDWLEWLASMRRHRQRCLFAVAPDVLGDAKATWKRSRPYLPTIRQLGFKAALVAQDGFHPLDVDWHDFDCLFIGGTDEFKLSEDGGYLAAEAARVMKKWIHLGRVNSLRRLRTAQGNCFNSADGTYVKFGPDQNLPRVYQWLDEINGQRALFR